MGLFERKEPAHGDLRDFATSRTGIEGFLEPATSMSKPTLLLVAGDGESIRRQVSSTKWAEKFCKQHHIPCYDPRRVGYPQRLRDYQKHNQTSEQKPSRLELTAIMTLESISGSDPIDDNPSNEQLRALLKTARFHAHPDRNGGDRSKWDRVESAAHQLGLL